MKAQPSSSWNNLLDRLVQTLDSSRKIQRKLLAETNAEAMKQVKERLQNSGKNTTRRRGRPPKQFIEVHA
jgi:hypothetical protein